MTTEQRLFRLAPEAVIASAHYVHGHGWLFVFKLRRGDESWEEAEEVRYSDLTTEELADVICATAESLLLRL